VIAALVAVAGCHQSPQANARQQAVERAASNQSEIEGPSADMNASLALDQLGSLENHLPPAQAPELPPPGDIRFAGRWAHSPSECKDMFWSLTRSEISGPSLQCSVRSIGTVAGGYDLEARCGRRETDETVYLRFAESARALLVESPSIGNKGLVFCGR
jgi:hypothetical protein